MYLGFHGTADGFSQQAHGLMDGLSDSAGKQAGGQSLKAILSLFASACPEVKSHVVRQYIAASEKYNVIDLQISFG